MCISLLYRESCCSCLRQVIWKQWYLVWKNVTSDNVNIFNIKLNLKLNLKFFPPLNFLELQFLNLNSYIFKFLYKIFDKMSALKSDQTVKH